MPVQPMEDGAMNDGAITVGGEQEPNPELSPVGCPYCGEPMDCTGAGPADQLDWTCGECGAWASFHGGTLDTTEDEYAELAAAGCRVAQEPAQ